MLQVYKYMLGPVLLSQGRRMRRTALRLPEAAGAREGRVGSGDAPVRLLFVGDSSMAGVGVDIQEEAMAFQSAGLLAQRTQRPVQWQMVARSGVNTREALALIEQHALIPADVVVTALGVNDVTSQRTPRQFLADYQALIAGVFARTGARAAVITGLPPLHVLPAAPQPLRWYLGQCAFRLDACLNKWAREARHLVHLPMQWAAQPDAMARDGYHPGLALYRRWAELVAESVNGLLAATPAPQPVADIA